jgi:hypothetical protein
MSARANSERACPFTLPSQPDLRWTAFKEEGELWHRWTWEPDQQRWFYRNTSTAAERDAARHEHERLMHEHPITDEELAWVAEVAKEIGDVE